MQYWLIKSEPGDYSWQDLQNDKVAEWDGVRNYQARNNMMKMRNGDLAFFYHSVNEKRIMGIAKVVKEHYPDPSDLSGRFCMVDFTACESLKNPVTLAAIKAEDTLQEIALIKQSRLSVMPLTCDEWQAILKLSNGG